MYNYFYTRKFYIYLNLINYVPWSFFKIFFFFLFPVTITKSNKPLLLSFLLDSTLSKKISILSFFLFVKAGDFFFLPNTVCFVFETNELNKACFLTVGSELVKNISLLVLELCLLS